MIRFLPLGGAGEIGANSFYLNINGTGIILDSGMHPKKNGVDALPDFQLIANQPVDYVLISHAHQDHLDSLPYLVQRFPHVKIVTTPQTRAIAELTLHNSVSIMREQVEIGEIKIYSHEEIDLLIQSIHYKSYGEKFTLHGYQHSGSTVTAEFYDAGHILGSAGLLLETEGKRNFYTGDINLANQSLLKGAELPDGKIDTLILECTYGATDSSSVLSWEQEAVRLANEINKVFAGGGSILIPVFALGKMQEILATLWNLMQTGKLVQTDIYTGGIAGKISKVYDYNRYAVNRVNPEFELLSVPQKDYYKVENYNRFFQSPCIVLASSGMVVERTASFNFARRWLKEKKSAIFTVGYMDEDTPGYKIANSKRGDKIQLTDFNRKEEVMCDIKQFRFSAHSKREGLLKIVEKLKPENVILVHGDVPALDWMGAAILKKFKSVRVYLSERGKEILV